MEHRQGSDWSSRPGVRPPLLHRYLETRRATRVLCEPLAVEDYVVQTMADVSPPKWHLAHTSWFFERFLLIRFLSDYRLFDRRYDFLFNSYYESLGPRFPRADRGMLSRPTVDEVYRYCAYVDEGMARLLGEHDDPPPGAVTELTELGIQHEQQHQELLLMDIKHIFANNPLRPAYHRHPPRPAATPVPVAWVEVPGGLYPLGAPPSGFAYDVERPRHRVFLEDFRLASRLVTNGEFLEFIEAGGYRRPEYWLSDGWQSVRERGWRAPLYWEQTDGAWQLMTLAGMRALDPLEPVCHVSYYEADAFARWAGKRLPSEAEWEVAVGDQARQGNSRETGHLHPLPAAPAADERLAQCYGDVWEWTRSGFAAYPGYRAAGGALGEYNGKFLCNQLVLRGGACVTPADHLRPSYRNFFFGHNRWQFGGIRLADGP